MRPSVVLLISLLVPIPAAAQKSTAPAPATGNTPTNPGSTGSNLPRNTNPFPSNNPNTQQPSVMTPRPIMISGRVVLEDGTPPPELVRVEKICTGNPRPQGYTDHRGHFSFQLDSGMGIMPDASDVSFNPSGTPGMSQGAGSQSGMGSQGRNMMMNCSIRAVLPGYRSDEVSLALHDSFDNPNIGTIVLHRIGNSEGTTISMTSLNAPKDAKKAFEKALESLKHDKRDEAEKSLLKAVEIYPKYSTAWYQLGRLQEERKQDKDAAQSYQQAIDADAKYVNPYVHLALIRARANDWEKTVEITDRAIKLDSTDFPEAYFYNAIANLNLRKLDAAEKSAEQVAKLERPQQKFPKLDHLMSEILAQKGDYAGAAEKLRGYLKNNPDAKDAKEVSAQLAELDKRAQNAPK